MTGTELWGICMIEKIKNLHTKKKALERVQRQIEKLEQGIVADVVRDYRHNPKGTPIVIRGDNGAKIADLRRFYTEQVQSLAEDIKTAENLILSVEDDRDRLVLQLRFIDGLRRWQIAEELDISERSIDLILQKYR